MRRLALLSALVLLLCACTAVPAETTQSTAPATLPLPTETAEPLLCPVETTAPVAAGMTTEEAAALLDFTTDPNWLARSLGCLYEHPHELDLYYLFYLGVEHPGSWDDISEESRQSLIDQDFLTDMDLQIMPAEKLETALQEAFGISLDSVTIPESWGYIEKENAYCSNHSDAYFPGVPNITSLEDDGVRIFVHYTIDGYWIPETDEFLDTANLVLYLLRNDDGTIHAVSNLLES